MTEVHTDETSAKNGTNGRGKPKWELDARERVRTTLRLRSRALAALVERDANEGDTRLFVTDFLCEALGYDKYEDLTTEYAVKGEFADYGLRVDKDLVAFIEVKRATTKLNPKHLRQVQAYAVNEGVEWAILTNGQEWQVYKLSPRMGPTGPLVEVDLTLKCDLLGADSPTKKVDDLFYLTRDAMKRHLIADLWRMKSATSPKSIAQVVCSEPIVEAIRKELRRRTGHKAEPAEILAIIQSAVLLPDLV